MIRDENNGLFVTVLGTALLLAGVVLYYAVTGHLNRSKSQSVPTKTSTGNMGSASAGSGGDSSETPSSMAPLLIHPPSRGSAETRPIASQVPSPVVPSGSRKKTE